MTMSLGITALDCSEKSWRVAKYAAVHDVCRYWMPK